MATTPKQKKPDKQVTFDAIDNTNTDECNSHEIDSTDNNNDSDNNNNHDEEECASTISIETTNKPIKRRRSKRLQNQKQRQKDNKHEKEGVKKPTKRKKAPKNKKKKQKSKKIKSKAKQQVIEEKPDIIIKKDNKRYRPTPSYSINIPTPLRIYLFNII